MDRVKQTQQGGGSEEAVKVGRIAGQARVEGGAIREVESEAREG